MNLRNKRVLITGAASGIGRATAHTLGRRGAKLILTDIDEAALEQTRAELGDSGVDVEAHLVDVADPDAMAKLAEQVHAVGPLDILINNAGVGVGGGIIDTSLEDWGWVIDVNLRGVVHGVHFFGPEVRAGGHILNVASVAGLVATEQLGAYSTTKFAVVGLSEALRQELAPREVAVTAICPGFISTNIARNMRYVGRMANVSVRDKVEKMLDARGAEPQVVADAIMGALKSRRGLVVVTHHAKILSLLKRLLPERVSALSKLAAMVTG